MTTDPKLKYQPTEAQRELDAHVAQRRAQADAEGRAGGIERLASIVCSGASPDRAMDLAEVMPEIMASFARMEAHSAKFFDEVRAKVAAAPQGVACEFHPSIVRGIDFDLSCRLARERRGEFVAGYSPCPECEAGERQARQRRYWARRGVPERVLEATLANYEATSDGQRRAVRLVKEWIAKRGNFLILLGTAGTGKGHLAAAAMKAIGGGVWVEHVNMLADLRASYQTKTTQDLIETWQDAEVLTLDEFGLSPGGRDEEPMLYQVIADRYERRRPTILTTNLDQAALRAAIGFRLLDRIRHDLTEVVCEWESFRRARQ